MDVTFAELVTLYRRIEFKKNSRCGLLLLENQDDCNFINDLLNNQERYGISFENGNIAPGNKIEVRVDHPQTRLGYVFSDLAGLLKSPERQHKEPDDYFLIDVKFSGNDEDIPDCIVNYRTVLKFVELIEERAAYFDTTEHQLIFLTETEVFKLHVYYDSETITRLQRESLIRLMSCIEEGIHKNPKTDMLVRSIQTLGKHTKSKDVFGCILRNLPELTEQFDKEYQIFASGFSYEKVKDQLRATKIEEIARVHQTFSAIQNQILGIPVASVIVVTQLKEATSWWAQGVINTGIILGCIIFIVLAILTLCNQQQTLKSIKQDILLKENQIKTKYSFIESETKETFAVIHNKICIQNLAFYFIEIVLTIGLVLTMIVYYLFTKPAFHHLYIPWC